MKSNDEFIRATEEAIKRNKEAIEHNKKMIRGNNIFLAIVVPLLIFQLFCIIMACLSK